MIAQEEAKEDAPHMSAEMERRILLTLWRDRAVNAEISQRTNTKDIVVAALKLKWKWRGHGPAKMGARCINLGLKSRQKQNWETEDPMADTLQRSRRTFVRNSQNQERVE
jgi:hypothetical protein